MPKLEGKKQEQDKQLTSLLQEELGENKKKPEKINLGDTASLKRALDDAAIQVLRDQGYQINNVLTDSKIALGALSCIVACIAQFWPEKYPKSYWIYVACAATYFILSMIHSLVHILFEKDIIALTYVRPDQPALAVRSKMPRFQENYTISIRPRDGEAVDRAQEATLVSSVGAFFDTEGVLAEKIFKAEVLKLAVQAVGGLKSKSSHANNGSKTD